MSDYLASLAARKVNGKGEPNNWNSWNGNRRGWVRACYLQTPMWANPKIMQRMCRQVAEMNKRGGSYCVDHIVPLSSKIVSGLNCEANLQILSHKANMYKMNKFWPDMWDEQQDLFPETKSDFFNLERG